MSRRFWSSYVASLVVLTTLISAVSSYAYLAEGPRVGAERLLLVSSLRSSAPMAAGSALLLALVLWAEALTPARLAQQLEHGLKRALSLALPGYLSAAAVALGVCFAMALALLAPRSGRFGDWLADLSRSDVTAGLAFTLFDSALIGVLAWRYAVRLRAMPMSLPAKLIVVVTVTVPLRATLAFVAAPFLPG